ncbi:hypothetical protein ACFV0W_24685, partial [Streptomyces anulatus]
MPQGEGTAVVLRPPRNTLNERAVGWWRAQWLLLTAVPVVPLAVLGALIEPARFWLLLPAAVRAAGGTAAAGRVPPGLVVCFIKK